MNHAVFFKKKIILLFFFYVVCDDISEHNRFPSFSLPKVELGFHSGDIIYVLGEMDQDGFYYVSFSAVTALWSLR